MTMLNAGEMLPENTVNRFYIVPSLNAGTKFRRVMSGKLNPSQLRWAPPVHMATGGHGFHDITLRNFYVSGRI